MNTLIDSQVILILSLAGSFANGFSGGLAGVRARLDAFGVIAMAIICGLGGTVIRDMLLGQSQVTFRDWRYIVVLGLAGFAALIDQGRLLALAQMIRVLDSLGLALFSVTGCLAALQAHLPIPEAVLLGTLSAIGGGVLRDVLLRRVPDVLFTGLSGSSALLGSLVAAGFWIMGEHGWIGAGAGAVAALLLRHAALERKWELPQIGQPRTDRSFSRPPLATTSSKPTQHGNRRPSVCEQRADRCDIRTG